MEALVSLDILNDSNVDFPGRALEISESEQQLLGGAHAEKRLYLIDGEAWVFTMIDGSGNRHAVHDPMYCFVGDGWNVFDKQDASLPRGEGRHVKLNKAEKKLEVLYWFSTTINALDQSFSNGLNRQCVD